VFNPVKEIKKSWVEIPIEVQRFLKRALMIFIVWKLLYTFILFPLNIPDKQLRNATSWGTVQLLKLKFPTSIFSTVEKENTDKITGEKSISDNIIKDNKKIVGIADPCNGLELYVLYISFLFCFFSKLIHRLLYILIGFVIIYIANILRCYFIGLLNIERFNLIDIAHHYVFKLIMYAIIFGLWIFFLRTNNRQNVEVAQKQPTSINSIDYYNCYLLVIV
jgi:exosortase/archaeosortase family protein